MTLFLTLTAATFLAVAAVRAVAGAVMNWLEDRAERDAVEALRAPDVEVDEGP